MIVEHGEGEIQNGSKANGFRHWSFFFLSHSSDPLVSQLGPFQTPKSGFGFYIGYLRDRRSTVGV